jgi:hypothetical protein
MLKEARQDLFRAETKLKVERRWKWPIRVFCGALGVGGLAAFQTETVRSGIAEFWQSLLVSYDSAGNGSLIALLVLGAIIAVAGYFIRRAMQGPSPEKTAQRLMEQFARKDGVAAYVFAGEDSAEDDAATVGALTRPEHRRFRKRKLTPSNRTLASSMTRILNRADEHEQTLLH